MSDTVIKVEGLGKEYNIGALNKKQQYDTLRDKIASGFKATKKHLAHRKSTMLGADKFWALRDVSFEVKQGEVLGIIGKNGAGKSTLLKILCKVTSPTEGRATLKGRVGTLLEVGTGFHPELTGRENIYLSGAILGMDKAYIERKIDEIIDFSGIEKFIDTPVKRYSNGMRVRLGFAVAAHLEPEILLIDEVLAVGDIEFQKKCLKQMDKITSVGRTILFVSHRMSSIRTLCDKCILLEDGQIKIYGDSDEVVDRYLAVSDSSMECSFRKWDISSAPGDENCRLLELSVFDSREDVQSVLSSDDNIFIKMHVYIEQPQNSLKIGFDLHSSTGCHVLQSFHTDSKENKWVELKNGYNVILCKIKRGLFNSDTYRVYPRISLHGIKWIINSDIFIPFTVRLAHHQSPYWNLSNQSNHPGAISPILHWEKQISKYEK